MISDPEEKREAVRKTCALRYWDGYPDTKVIDPHQRELPSLHDAIVEHIADVCLTPEIMRNQQYAKEYLGHVELIRQLSTLLRQPHQLHPQRPGATQCRDSLDILSRCP